MAGNLSELEEALLTLVRNYDKYAEKSFFLRYFFGKQGKISKENFGKMLNEELSHVLSNTDSKTAAQEMFADMDLDEDGKMSFDEYWRLIGGIINQLLHVKQQVQERDG
ncbi:protein S100-A16-like isoform X1 [Podarcis raffonei]|uniref:Protein S100-A16-like n=2 Tax=Podarcis TaxID=42163 RepID=A0A670JEV5_PODMU|nr:protein S100-A16-like [Podarcis muralis]XP_028566299.1 protein S100-A16-like [Podarcis muralis]XP_053224723.1 protein S100-A16-like isoform X1 [Podarcis raffonei]XP_053224724.1 protein S100-A16-like isoform X2 [Podarcis raffonei]XP_053224725.1 protein S100-A16-like isoform X1 [Podarcis raffonei]CAI5798388.1 protein S100-A16 isoform X2 [Podarcis lilfordi]